MLSSIFFTPKHWVQQLTLFQTILHPLDRLWILSIISFSIQLSSPYPFTIPWRPCYQPNSRRLCWNTVQWARRPAASMPWLLIWSWRRRTQLCRKWRFGLKNVELDCRSKFFRCSRRTTFWKRPMQDIASCSWLKHKYTLSRIAWRNRNAMSCSSNFRASFGVSRWSCRNHACNSFLSRIIPSLEREVEELKSQMEELQRENDKTKEEVKLREEEIAAIRKELRASQYAYMKWVVGGWCHL